jgi:hypothetical protein
MHLNDASSKWNKIVLKTKYCYTVLQNLWTFEHQFYNMYTRSGQHTIIKMRIYIFR